MLQAFTEISTNTFQSNWFELALVAVAVIYARGTIVPMFLLVYCIVFNAYQSLFESKLNQARLLYDAGAYPYESVLNAYNAFYVMGGLVFMCMAFILAYIKPIRSKTGFAYCIALCIQSLLSIAMFANGLEVTSKSGEYVVDIPEIELIAALHGFVNGKMIIITVLIAWISVVLSRTAKR